MNLIRPPKQLQTIINSVETDFKRHMISGILLDRGIMSDTQIE